ncbi:MAG: tRNA (adenosine(37)-N6)-threonylcarbamoyltransferase complex dimerization subunit type 1 TsaB [Planctomycetota bacterium]
MNPKDPPDGSTFFSGLDNERILLIDTSGARAVAILVRANDGLILAPDAIADIPSEPLDMAANIGGTLFPLIDALLKDAKTTPTDLTGILVNRGPGSWTGLRVGVAAAKTLALVLKVPVFAFSNLEALALEGMALMKDSGNPLDSSSPSVRESSVNNKRIAVLLDGRSAGLFGAVYRFGQGTKTVLERVADEMSASADEWKDWLTLTQSDDPDASLSIVTDSPEKAGSLIANESSLSRWRILSAARASLPATVVCALSSWKNQPDLRLAGSAVHSLAPAYLRGAHFKKIRP